MRVGAVLLFLFICVSTFGQEITQTIRGQVVDQESRFPLIGVNVVLISDTTKLVGGISDENGNYRLDNIPVGRHAIRFTYLGYEEKVLSNIVVGSAKEVILNVKLEESLVSLEAVTITGRKKGQVLNEMASVSAQAFSVDETDRYAGSRSDPARMASNFAGIQGQDDSRNDIVVRGNSPLGILWRVEGIDIPNPNHFAIAGSAGGPVSILNNKTLTSSDFFTGAFPAEFGNSVSGVFDLRLRNGNNQKHESSFQFGFLGTELMLEGPLSKETGSSYLVTYRYSTLSLFSALGIDIGTDAVPKYQDASFKLNFPTKKGGNISVFGLGGASDIDILISEQEKPEVDLYGENDRDQFFGTSMGVIGATYTKSMNENTYVKTSVALSGEEQHSEHIYLHRHIDADGFWVVDSTNPLMGYQFAQGKFSLSSHLNKKLDRANSLKMGVNADYYRWKHHDTAFLGAWTTRWDYRGGGFLLQPYVQWKWKITEDFTLNSGIHAQIFTLNNSVSGPEPRLGMRYKLNEKQVLSAGIGMHSQLQPTYTYFYQQYDGNGNPVLHNIDMGFTKSDHYIMGYENSLTKNLRMKSEVYYQRLYNIPVEVNPSSFSLVNQGSGFQRFFPDSLMNAGTGRNVGIELTFEKFFHRNYYFLFSGSIFDSKYRGSDGVERDTDYNGRYAFNLLAGKEFSVGKKGILGVGTKFTTAGGRRYGPVDIPASKAINELVWVDSTYNTLRLSDYLRWDLKINYKINAKKVSHEIALDLVNVLGIENVLGLTYAPDPTDPNDNPIRENYQLGFLPIFYYRIDF